MSDYRISDFRIKKFEIMEKKLYNNPLVEVEDLKLSGVLMASPQGDSTPPPPLDPGLAPKRRAEVF